MSNTNADCTQPAKTNCPPPAATGCGSDAPTLTVTGSGINDGHYTISGSANDDGSLLITDDCTGKVVTEIWGDPHVNVDGANIAEFTGENLVISLPDGTRVLMQPTAITNGVAHLANVTVTNGADAATINGVNGDFRNGVQVSSPWPGAASQNALFETGATNLTLGTNGNLYLTAANGVKEEIVSANGTAVDLDGMGGAAAIISGGGDTVGGGADDILYLENTNGNFDTVNASADVVKDATGKQTAGVTLASNTQAWVYGDGNMVAAGTGSSLGVSGGGNTISAEANDLLVVGNTNGDFDTINASNVSGTTAIGQIASISMFNNSQAWVYGNSNTINAGTGSSLGVSGGGNTINAGANDLLVIGNTNGDFDAITAFNVRGTTAIGQIASISMFNNSQTWVSGSGNVINAGIGSSLGVNGGGNAINAGANDLVVLQNTNGLADLVNVSDDFGGTTAIGQQASVYVDNNAQALINGTNDLIGLGSHAAIALSAGSTDTVDGGNADQIALSAAHLTLQGGTGSMIFAGAGASSIADLAIQTTVMVNAGTGNLAISNVAGDAQFVLDMSGGVGGYKNASGLINALQNDGHGGTMLTLGSGSGAHTIDFVNTSKATLTAAHFKFT